jgi:hypothetical protein
MIKGLLDWKELFIREQELTVSIIGEPLLQCFGALQSLHLLFVGKLLALRLFSRSQTQILFKNFTNRFSRNCQLLSNLSNRVTGLVIPSFGVIVRVEKFFKLLNVGFVSYCSLSALSFPILVLTGLLIAIDSIWDGLPSNSKYRRHLFPLYRSLENQVANRRTEPFVFKLHNCLERSTIAKKSKKEKSSRGNKGIFWSKNVNVIFDHPVYIKGASAHLKSMQKTLHFKQ